MRLSRVVAVVVAALASAVAAPDDAHDAGGAVPFYVSKTRKGKTHPDAIFVRWAFDAWSKASNGKLQFVEVDTESDAPIRVDWAGRNNRKYGEMRVTEVDGKRGAEVFINTSTEGLGADVHARAMRDRLFRDSVVFLTCVHEIGHALGLSHTANFADIMYSFHYGGDVESYFQRYRRQVKKREQMRERSPLSENDIARLRALYHGATDPSLTSAGSGGS